MTQDKTLDLLGESALCHPYYVTLFPKAFLADGFLAERILAERAFWQKALKENLPRERVPWELCVLQFN